MSHHDFDGPEDYLWMSNGDGNFWPIHRDRLNDLACGNAMPRNATEMVLFEDPGWLELYLDRMSGDYVVIIPAGGLLPMWNPDGLKHGDYLWVLKDTRRWLPIHRDRLGDLASGNTPIGNKTEELLVQNPEWLNFLYRTLRRRLPDDDRGERAVTHTLARIEIGERTTVADIIRQLNAAKLSSPKLGKRTPGNGGRPQG
jgi:hypothetical protein